MGGVRLNANPQVQHLLRSRGTEGAGDAAKSPRVGGGLAVVPGGKAPEEGRLRAWVEGGATIARLPGSRVDDLLKSKVVDLITKTAEKGLAPDESVAVREALLEWAKAMHEGQIENLSPAGKYAAAQLIWAIRSGNAKDIAFARGIVDTHGELADLLKKPAAEAVDAYNGLSAEKRAELTAVKTDVKTAAPVAALAAKPPVATLSLGEVAGKLAKGGIKSLNPTELESLLSFVERTLSGRAPLPKVKGDFVMGLVLALAKALQASVKSGELGKYLTDLHLDADWKGRIEKLQAAEPNVKAPDPNAAVGMVVAVKDRANNPMLAGISIPVVSAKLALPPGHVADGPAAPGKGAAVKPSDPFRIQLQMRDAPAAVPGNGMAVKPGGVLSRFQPDPSAPSQFEVPRAIGLSEREAEVAGMWSGDKYRIVPLGPPPRQPLPEFVVPDRAPVPGWTPLEVPPQIWATWDETKRGEIEKAEHKTEFYLTEYKKALDFAAKIGVQLPSRAKLDLDEIQKAIEARRQNPIPLEARDFDKELTRGLTEIYGAIADLDLPDFKFGVPNPGAPPEAWAALFNQVNGVTEKTAAYIAEYRKARALALKLGASTVPNDRLGRLAQPRFTRVGHIDDIDVDQIEKQSGDRAEHSSHDLNNKLLWGLKTIYTNIAALNVPELNFAIPNGDAPPEAWTATGNQVDAALQTTDDYIAEYRKAAALAAKLGIDLRHENLVRALGGTVDAFDINEFERASKDRSHNLSRNFNAEIRARLDKAYSDIRSTCRTVDLELDAPKPDAPPSAWAAAVNNINPDVVMARQYLRGERDLPASWQRGPDDQVYPTPVEVYGVGSVFNVLRSTSNKELALKLIAEQIICKNNIAKVGQLERIIGRLQRSDLRKYFIYSPLPSTDGLMQYLKNMRIALAQGNLVTYYNQMGLLQNELKVVEAQLTAFNDEVSRTEQDIEKKAQIANHIMMGIGVVASIASLGLAAPEAAAAYATASAVLKAIHTGVIVGSVALTAAKEYVVSDINRRDFNYIAVGVDALCTLVFVKGAPGATKLAARLLQAGVSRELAEKMASNLAANVLEKAALEYTSHTAGMVGLGAANRALGVTVQALLQRISQEEKAGRKVPYDEFVDRLVDDVLNKAFDLDGVKLDAFFGVIGAATAMRAPRQVFHASLKELGFDPTVNQRPNPQEVTEAFKAKHAELAQKLAKVSSLDQDYFKINKEISQLDAAYRNVASHFDFGDLDGAGAPGADAAKATDAPSKESSGSPKEEGAAPKARAGAAPPANEGAQGPGARRRLPIAPESKAARADRAGGAPDTRTATPVEIEIAKAQGETAAARSARKTIVAQMNNVTVTVGGKTRSVGHFVAEYNHAIEAANAARAKRDAAVKAGNGTDLAELTGALETAKANQAAAEQEYKAAVSDPAVEPLQQRYTQALHDLRFAEQRYRHAVSKAHPKLAELGDYGFAAYDRAVEDVAAFREVLEARVETAAQEQRAASAALIHAQAERTNAQLELFKLQKAEIAAKDQGIPFDRSQITAAEQRVTDKLAAEAAARTAERNAGDALNRARTEGPAARALKAAQDRLKQIESGELPRTGAPEVNAPRELDADGPRVRPTNVHLIDQDLAVYVDNLQVPKHLQDANIYVFHGAAAGKQINVERILKKIQETATPGKPAILIACELSAEPGEVAPKDPRLVPMSLATRVAGMEGMKFDYVRSYTQKVVVLARDRLSYRAGDTVGLKRLPDAPTLTVQSGPEPASVPAGQIISRVGGGHFVVHDKNLYVFADDVHSAIPGESGTDGQPVTIGGKNKLLKVYEIAPDPRPVERTTLSIHGNADRYELGRATGRADLFENLAAAERGKLDQTKPAQHPVNVVHQARLELFEAIRTMESAQADWHRAKMNGTASEADQAKLTAAGDNLRAKWDAFDQLAKNPEFAASVPDRDKWAAQKDRTMRWQSPGPEFYDHFDGANWSSGAAPPSWVGASARPPRAPAGGSGERPGGAGKAGGNQPVAAAREPVLQTVLRARALAREFHDRLGQLKQKVEKLHPLSDSRAFNAALKELKHNVAEAKAYAADLKRQNEAHPGEYTQAVAAMDKAVASGEAVAARLETQRLTATTRVFAMGAAHEVRECHDRLLELQRHPQSVEFYAELDRLNDLAGKLNRLVTEARKASAAHPGAFAQELKMIESAASQANQTLEKFEKLRAANAVIDTAAVREALGEPGAAPTEAAPEAPPPADPAAASSLARSRAALQSDLRLFRTACEQGRRGDAETLKTRMKEKVERYSGMSKWTAANGNGPAAANFATLAADGAAVLAEMERTLASAATPSRPASAGAEAGQPRPAAAGGESEGLYFDEWADVNPGDDGGEWKTLRGVPELVEKAERNKASISAQDIRDTGYINSSPTRYHHESALFVIDAAYVNGKFVIAKVKVEPPLKGDPLTFKCLINEALGHLRPPRFEATFTDTDPNWKSIYDLIKRNEANPGRILRRMPQYEAGWTEVKVIDKTDHSYRIGFSNPDLVGSEAPPAAKEEAPPAAAGRRDEPPRLAAAAPGPRAAEEASPPPTTAAAGAKPRSFAELKAQLDGAILAGQMNASIPAGLPADVERAVKDLAALRREHDEANRWFAQIGKTLADGTADAQKVVDHVKDVIEAWNKAVGDYEKALEGWQKIWKPEPNAAADASAVSESAPQITKLPPVRPLQAKPDLRPDIKVIESRKKSVLDPVDSAFGRFKTETPRLRAALGRYVGGAAMRERIDRWEQANARVEDLTRTGQLQTPAGRKAKADLELLSANLPKYPEFKRFWDSYKEWTKAKEAVSRRLDVAKATLTRAEGDLSQKMADAHAARENASRQPGNPDLEARAARSEKEAIEQKAVVEGVRESLNKIQLSPELRDLDLK